MGERISAIRLAAPPAPLAAWHTISGIAASYDTGTEPDIAAYLTGQLNLSGVSPYSGGVVQIKPLTITVGDYTWTEPDSGYIRRAIADVSVRFPDGSCLTRHGVVFSRYDDSGVVLVRGETGAEYIDTGLTMNYGYEFRAEGCAILGNQAVLLGAFASTSERTTLRLLGAGNKVQHMWPGLGEATSAASGIDFRRLFAYVQNSTGATLTQGETTYTVSRSGTSSGTGTAKILLFNEAAGGSYGHGILSWAEIRDNNGNVLRHFEPRKFGDEWVLVDTAHDNQVYRPASGKLIEVTPED